MLFKGIGGNERYRHLQRCSRRILTDVRDLMYSSERRLRRRLKRKQ